MRIDGEDVDAAPPARRRRLLAFLPASRDIAWPIAARDVIALGLDRRDEARIDDADRAVGARRTCRPPGRPAVDRRTHPRPACPGARRAPHMLLLDEPLSNLEPYWVLRFLEILSRPRRRRDAGRSSRFTTLASFAASIAALLIAGGTVQMDEAPAGLVASERFEEIFRIRAARGGWTISRRRIGDHRRETGFGSELAVDRGPAGEFAHRSNASGRTRRRAGAGNRARPARGTWRPRSP